jgi:hypothetical protein
MRIVRYLGVLTLLLERHLCGDPAVIHSIRHTSRQKVGGIVLARASLTSDRNATRSSCPAPYQPDAYIAMWGKYPFQSNRMHGKVTDDKEARETTRPKIDQTAFKAV